MTQIATVEQVLRDGRVKISVPRKSACGHDCEECAGCGVSGASVYAIANDPIGVQPGQKVVVESSTKSLYGMFLMVYIVPVLFFFAGYFAAAAAISSEGMRCAAAIAAFCIGIVPAVLFDRRIKRKGSLQFTITKIL